MHEKMIVLVAAAGLAHSASGFATFASRIQQLQESMITQAKTADPTATWTVDAHSRGKACILEDGEVWEKGCISVTLIEDGELSAVRAATISGRTGTTISEGARYSACALSFVLHAHSPLVPTLRGDARVFVVGDDEWYGGGLDLTPSYVEPDDCAHFHASLSELCGDVLSIVFSQLCNSLEPRLAIYFGSASSELRLLLTPALRQQLTADHEVAAALCRKMGMRSCKELREASLS